MRIFSYGHTMIWWYTSALINIENLIKIIIVPKIGTENVMFFGTNFRTDIGFLLSPTMCYFLG